ncbi:MAG: hypothetical protein IMZ47_03650 [Firmicutes bacterium]|nr:hypothetical protein [Bacillota bacterium]
MEHQFNTLMQNYEENSIDKENLYISEKLLIKISKYLEKEPTLLRCDEVCEEGWFNKKESYIKKRLKHKRDEGKYHLGISNIYRSFNGKRITRYLLFWLYERDVYYINQELDIEPYGEAIPMDALTNLYHIINIDDEQVLIPAKCTDSDGVSTPPEYNN